MVPGVWLHAGHTQIDWCNQLVTRLAATLLEVVAQQQQQQQDGVHGMHGSGHVHGRSLQGGLHRHHLWADTPPTAAAAAAEAAPALPPAAAATAAAAAEPRLSRAAVTGQVLLQYLTGDAVNSLTGMSLHSWPPAMSHEHEHGHERSHERHQSQALRNSTQQQQQGSGDGLLAPTWMRHSRPSNHQQQHSHQHTDIEMQSQQQQQQQHHKGPFPLLLFSLAPPDVQLAHADSCSDLGPDPAAAAGHGPGWYIHSQGAAAVNLPDPQLQQTYYKATPAAAATVEGRSADGDVLGGTVYIWDVAAAAAAAAADTAAGASADFVMVASGAKPCTGFRVWVGQSPGDPTAAAAAGGGVVWRDVTSLVVPLPTVEDAMVLPVRDSE